MVCESQLAKPGANFNGLSVFWLTLEISKVFKHGIYFHA